MRRLPVLLLVAAGLAGCESAVPTPGELTVATKNALEVLPPGATVVGMFDAEAARASSAFETLTDGKLAFRGLDGEGAARFDAFVEATGFDPQEDLRRVYFATMNEDEAPYFVVYADYDRDRLDAYVSGQPDLEFERTSYGEVPVYVHREADGDEMAFALVNDDMLVGSSSAGVHAMIDRLTGTAAGLQDDAAMMALVRRAGYPEGMWVAVRDLPEHEASAHGSPLGQAGSTVEDVVVSLGFERGGVAIAALAQTRSGVDNADVADLIRGSISAARLNAKDDPDLLKALDDVRVRETAEGVEVQAFLPDATVRAMKTRHATPVRDEG